MKENMPFLYYCSFQYLCLSINFEFFENYLTYVKIFYVEYYSCCPDFVLSANVVFVLVDHPNVDLNHSGCIFHYGLCRRSSSMLC